MEEGSVFRHNVNRVGPGARNGLSRERGVTLLELMIALVILTVSILGLLSLTVTSIQANMQNDVRNTAIRLTNQVAEAMRSQPITNVITGGLAPYSAANTALLPNYLNYPNPVQTIRGVPTTYTATWTVAPPLSPNLSQVTVTVGWTYRNVNYTNVAVVYKPKAN